MSLWKKMVARWGTAVQVDDVRMDAATSTLQAISFEHHEVHEGDHFVYTQIDADWDTADTVELLIITPNTTKWAHMMLRIEAALDTNVSFYEGATHTVLAEQTAYNNNRNSGTANTTTINTHNNDGVDGTKIFESQFGVSTGGGANKVVTGGSSRGAQEVILKQNTKYLLVLSTGTSNSVLSMELVWYEHSSNH